MKYFCKYNSLVGDIILVSDGKYLTNLFIKGQSYNVNIDECIELEHLDIFKNTKKWLDIYFSEKEPNINLDIKLNGTSFQKEIWEFLRNIPYGKTITYGEIANLIAKKRNIKKMSYRAVGHAVSKNPISIIIPCHRVIGKNNKLIGYNGGNCLKKKLLELEKIHLQDEYINI